MATALYRCPNTGFRVQGYTLDQTVSSDHDDYTLVTCLACKKIHVVNPKTGEVLGGGGKSSGAGPLP